MGDGCKEKGGVYGKEKEKRDLWVFLLWESGACANRETGVMFGIIYRVFSHIMKKAKYRMKSDQGFQRKHTLVKS